MGFRVTGSGMGVFRGRKTLAPTVDARRLAFGGRRGGGGRAKDGGGAGRVSRFRVWGFWFGREGGGRREVVEG